MSNYNWCHGPNCHTNHTQSRVRGSKGNKVLRTIKIKQGRYNGYQSGIWDYFCNQSCLFDFIKLHKDRIVALAPRREALETPIDVVVEDTTDWNGNPYKAKVIKEVVDKVIQTIDNA